MIELPGLYVHVPFCATKCPYCAFSSTPGVATAGTWRDALLREAEVRAPAFRDVDTLYLGGGTPTVLPDPVLVSAVRGLRAAFRIAPGAECTVEANPGDLDVRRAALLRAEGFDRLSLGVQALDDASLAFLGRRHDAATAIGAARAAREAGFESLGLDLIFGLPGQGVGDWLQTLDLAAALGPDHLSCYQLSVEPGTPLERAVLAGTVGELPEDARAADLFLAGSEHLAALGFQHYEVSNFARPGRRARHNGKYWRRIPYVGLGPSAHSFDGRRRWWNLPDVARWAGQVARRGHGEAGSEVLTAEQARLEEVSLGLRTLEGCAKAALAPGRERVLARLVADGKVREVGDRVVPTIAGLLVADALAGELA